MIDRNEIIRAFVLSGDSDFFAARAFVERHGFDIRKDGPDLIRFCLDGAERDLPEAQHALSKFMSAGIFGKIDRKEALKWAIRAEQQGYLPARYLLSTMYGDPSYEVADGRRRAIDMLKRAAQEDYAPALRTLGVMYLTGSDLELDSARGYSYLERAASGRDPYALLMIGRMLLEASEKELYPRALAMIEEAAKHRFPSALRQLAQFHRYGLYGLERNESLATALTEEAEKIEKG